MKTYKVIIINEPREFLKKLSNPLDEKRIRLAINSLAENPRKREVKKLTNSDPIQYQLRQGNYQIIFEIHDELFIVIIDEIVSTSIMP